MSRAEVADMQGNRLEYPEVTIQYLVQIFYQVGAAKSTGMGLVAIDWRDILAWQQVAGISLSPWEAENVIRMSKEYVSQSVDSQKASCPAPYVAAPPAKGDVAKSMLDGLRSLSKKR